MPKPTLVITGAAGGIGSDLWPRLRSDYSLRLVDRMPVAVDEPGLDNDARGMVADIADLRAMQDCFEGADAVVHLAGNRFTDATWGELMQPNLLGAQTVLEAAVRAGVPRVVLASSCHASGQYDNERARGIDGTWPARPCCPYGVSKVYAETSGRYYADHHGLQVICLRIGAVMLEPVSAVALAFWLSTGDLERLVRGALGTTVPYGVYYGGSRNARDRWNLAAAERDLGYVPVDDANDHIDDIDLTVPVAPCYSGAFDVLPATGDHA